MRLAGCILLLAGGLVFAQDPALKPHLRTVPADATELAAITERGRALAAYDAAAWYASDAVQALNPLEERIGMFLGHKTDAGWVMGFGQLNKAQDKFLLWYEAVPTANVKKPDVKVHEPALEDTGDWLHAARAFERFKPELSSHGRPYNLAVLPAPEGRWFVYSYPAQTDLKVFPYGADVRYTVSPDGTAVEDTHRMHASLLENGQPANGAKTEMTYRTAFLDDAPEDTDVADVIMMGHIPMVIAARTFVYRIEADGTAKYVAPTKVFLKDAKKPK